MQQDRPKGFSAAERHLAIADDRGFTDAYGEDEFGRGFLTRATPAVAPATLGVALKDAFDIARRYNDPEETVTDEEVRKLQRIQDFRSRRSTILGKIGDVSAMSLEFAPSFATGTVLAKGGMKLTAKLMSAEIKKALQKIGTGGVASRIATGVGKTVGYGAAGQAGMDAISAIIGQDGETVARARREQFQRAIALSDENNELAVFAIENAPSLTELLPKAFLEGTIERGSEFAGSFVFTLPKDGKLAAMSYFLLDKAAGKIGMKRAREVMQVAGWQGLLEEIGEEYYGALLSDLTAAASNGRFADSGQLAELTKLENAGIMVAGMALTMGGAQLLSGQAVGVLQKEKVEVPPLPTMEEAQRATGTGPQSPEQGVVAPKGAGALLPGEAAFAEPSETTESEPQTEKVVHLTSEEVDSFIEKSIRTKKRVRGEGSIPDAVINYGLRTVPDGVDLQYIGRGQFGKLKGPETGKYSTRKVIDSIKDAAMAFDHEIEVHQGRLPVGAKGAAGVWNWHDFQLSTQEAEHPMVAAHEMGHAFETFLYRTKRGPTKPIWRKGTKAVPEEVLKEVLRLGLGQARAQGFIKEDGTVENQQRWGKEGFAEFIAGYLSENPNLNAPNTVKWFEAQLTPKIQKALNKSKATWRGYRLDGAIGQGLASIGEKSLLEKASELATRKVARRRFLRSWSRRLWEQLEAFTVITKQAEKFKRFKGFGDLTGSERLDRRAQVLRGKHVSLVNHWLDHEVTDINGARLGPGLLAIRPLIKGAGRLFDVYLLARRTIELGAERPTPLTIDQAESIIEQLDERFPRMAEAAEGVYEWTRNVNTYLSQTSPTIAEQIANVEAGDVGAYIPLQRIFDATTSAWRKFEGNASIQAGTITKTLVGSFRAVQDPLATLIAQTQDRVLAAHQRMLMENAIELGRRYGGLGRWLFETDVDKYLAANPKVKNLIDAMLRSVGAYTKEAREAIVEALRQGKLDRIRKFNPDAKLDDIDLEELFNETVAFFAPSWNPKKGDNPVLPMRFFNENTQKTEMRYYVLDENLYRALMGIDQVQLGRFLNLTVGVPKKIATMGITGLSYTFGLITNPLRDLPTLYFNTRSHANAGEIFFTWLQAQMVAFVDGIRASILNTPFDKLHPQTQAYYRLHANMSTRLGADLREPKKRVRHITGHNLLTVNGLRDVFGQLIDRYQEVVQSPEVGSRMAEVRLLAKEYGVDLKDVGRTTQEQNEAFAFAAQRATTDFNAGGEWTRFLNTMIPFFNVQFQGPRATIEATMERPIRNLTRGATLAAMTLALWWMHKDEEWYRELSVEERARFWHFPAPDGINIVRIPRPWEIGALTAAPAELLADAFYISDPKGAKEFFGTLFRASDDIVSEFSEATPLGLVPNFGIPLAPGSRDLEKVLGRWLPVLPGLVMEQKSNRRLYWGTPIVSRANERKEPRDQYTDFTSRAAIRIGEITGWSPQRIDHAVNYVFGSTGRSILGTFGRGPVDIDFERDISDHWFLGRLFKRGGKYAYSDSARKVYDVYEKYDRRMASGRETEQERSVRLMLRHTTRFMTAMSYVRAREESVKKRAAISKEIASVAREAARLEEQVRVGGSEGKLRSDTAARVTAATDQIRRRRKAAEDLKAAVVERLRVKRSREEAASN